MFLLFYIAAALLLVYALLIAFYLRGWKSIPPFDVKKVNGPVTGPHVSLIVPARNEAQTIAHCLESLLAQSYPAALLEIIVVDDHSTDETAAVVRSFNASNLKLVDLSEHVRGGRLNSYKKKAIEVGISIASGELVVTTDADCSMQPDWISSLAAFYRQRQAAFISAPVKIETSASLLAVFQALDFMTLQGITGASVHKKFHSMCNGANLAYRRDLFYEVNGFRGIDEIASGDDMLLMHKIARLHPDRIFYLKDKAAIVSTGAMTTWKGFLNQRIRWASKTGNYDDKRILAVLFLVYILNFMLLVFLIAGAWNVRWLYGFLLLVVCKTVVEFSFVSNVAAFFGQRKLIIYFPLLQPLHILYTVIAGWLGRFGKYEWKGRQVK